MAKAYFPHSNQQQQQQQVITNYPINRVAGNYNNNRIELNSLFPSITDLMFSFGSLTNYPNESIPNFICEYTDKCGAYNTHRICDKNNRRFKFVNTNGREHRFLKEYKFTQIENINGEFYLSIDIPKYDSLRGGDLTAFNTKCGDTFSQINIDGERNSLKTERLRFQKRNCKNKHKHRWESCKKKYTKSSKTTSKATYEIPSPLAQSHIRSPLYIPLEIPLEIPSENTLEIPSPNPSPTPISDQESYWDFINPENDSNSALEYLGI